MSGGLPDPQGSEIFLREGCDHFLGDCGVNFNRDISLSSINLPPAKLLAKISSGVREICPVLS